MKNLLRQNAISIRNTLNCKTNSHSIIDQILDWNIFTKSCNIMLYYPIKNEISLLDILKVPDKNFYFPKINECDEVCILKYTNEFKRGKYKIPEPLSEINEDCQKIDLIFIPALMADQWGYRLGYGKGYYDRFLKKLSKNTVKAIPIYSELFKEDLPIEAHDEKADYIILPNKIIDTRVLIA